VSRYPIPAARHRHEQVVERSRFICTLAPAVSAAEAHAVIRDVAAAMPDAHHHCWAFVAGAPGNTDLVGSNDDGEPRGTAGRPMLVALLHSGVGEIVAVVTRYFGGVKLGTGGLARAYGGVVQAAISTLPRIDRVATTPCEVTLAYAHVAAVQHLLPRYGVTVEAQRFDVAVHLELQVPVEQAAALVQAIGDATRGAAAVRLGAPADG